MLGDRTVISGHLTPEYDLLRIILCCTYHNNGRLSWDYCILISMPITEQPKKEKIKGGVLLLKKTYINETLKINY